MADTDNRALEAFEAFMKTEAPSDYDASNGDAWYVWKACWAAALASRPAEVDDEELPPLPKHSDRFNVNGPDGHRIKGYTAEQFRQGQRDAVAADRARRGLVEEPFYPQLFLNWNRSQEIPPVAVGKEMYVAQKAVELSKAAPSHTTNKEK